MARRLVGASMTIVFMVLSLYASSAVTENVDIRDRSFDPRRIVIDAGDTVRWRVQDDENHSVTATAASRARGEAFDSSTNCPDRILFNNCLNRGDRFSWTFHTPGAFTYYCKVHGDAAAQYPDCGMCGVVIVRGAVSSPTTTPTTTAVATPTSTPSRTVSPSATSPSPSPTGVGTSPGGVAAPTGDGGGAAGPIAIAAVVVVVLAGSGLLVYRTLIKG